MPSLLSIGICDSWGIERGIPVWESGRLLEHPGWILRFAQDDKWGTRVFFGRESVPTIIGHLFENNVHIYDVECLYPSSIVRQIGLLGCPHRPSLDHSGATYLRGAEVVALVQLHLDCQYQH